MCDTTSTVSSCGGRGRGGHGGHGGNVHRSRAPYTIAPIQDDQLVACDVAGHKNFTLNVSHPRVRISFTHTTKRGRRGHVVVSACGASACEVDLDGNVLVAGVWPRTTPPGGHLCIEYYVAAQGVVSVDARLHAPRAAPTVTAVSWVDAAAKTVLVTFSGPVSGADVATAYTADREEAAGGALTGSVTVASVVADAAGANAYTLTLEDAGNADVGDTYRVNLVTGAITGVAGGEVAGSGTVVVPAA